MTTDLTTTQRNVYEYLPFTSNEAAEQFGISNSAVRNHVSNIRDNGYPIKNVDGVYEYAGDHPATNMRPPNRASKTAQSKAANAHLANLNDRLVDLLNRTPPAVADGGLEYNHSNEDVVIHRSDDHIGNLVEDEFGNVIFDREICVNRIRYVTDTVMRLIDREEDANRQFDTAHLLLGGDTVTGESIYQSQPHHICMKLDEQIDVAADLYFEQIERLAARFPSVQVVCQAGNHGELRADGMSEMANADRIVYGFLDKMVRMSDLDNVTVVRNDSATFTNFEIRGGIHRGHLRHGQNSLSHIGTSSGQNKWRGWQIRHGFDIAYRGHYHEFKLEHVMNRPVLMSGAICPPDDYEESLSVWSEPAATVHGVTDDYPLAWMYPIRMDTLNA